MEDLMEGMVVWEEVLSWLHNGKERHSVTLQGHERFLQRMGEEDLDMIERERRAKAGRLSYL
jgi:hypothetical protein